MVYSELKAAAKAGKPNALHAAQTIKDCEGAILKNARRHKTLLRRDILEEHLALAVLESNPWLATELAI